MGGFGERSLGPPPPLSSLEPVLFGLNPPPPLKPPPHFCILPPSRRRGRPYLRTCFKDKRLQDMKASAGTSASFLREGGGYRHFMTVPLADGEHRPALWVDHSRGWRGDWRTLFSFLPFPLFNTQNACPPITAYTPPPPVPSPSGQAMVGLR